jgi:hypothetical protein
VLKTSTKIVANAAFVYLASKQGLLFVAVDLTQNINRQLLATELSALEGLIANIMQST